jgi:hypothetical protein
MKLKKYLLIATAGIILIAGGFVALSLGTSAVKNEPPYAQYYPIPDNKDMIFMSCMP